MSLTVNINDTTGALVLAVTPANGYERTNLDFMGRVTLADRNPWPWVDGDFPMNFRRGPVQKTFAVKVTGTTWPTIETRTQTLLSAIDSLGQYQLEVIDGTVTYTYVADTQSIDASYTPSDRQVLRRFVTAQITLQPNPTITGA